MTIFAEVTQSKCINERRPVVKENNLIRNMR